MIEKFGGVCGRSRGVIIWGSSLSNWLLSQESTSSITFSTPGNHWQSLISSSMTCFSWLCTTSNWIVAWIGSWPSLEKLIFCAYTSDVGMLVIERKQSLAKKDPLVKSIHGDMVVAICSSKLFEALNQHSSGITCYAQLHCSHDYQESAFVDSNASFFGSLWHDDPILYMCPTVLLLFCLSVLNALSSSKPTLS